MCQLILTISGKGVGVETGWHFLFIIEEKYILTSAVVMLQ